MYQQLTLIGNLGAAPEMRYTPSGVAVTSFRLAVNRRWTDSEGMQKEKTTWFNVTTWRRQAENVNQYLSKGSKVLVVGEVEEARPWTDRDGNQRASIEVTANEVRFLDSRPQDVATAANGSGGISNSNGTTAATNGAASNEAVVVDIPL